MSVNDESPLVYYAAPGPMTDPGPHADLFQGLPTDIPSLVNVVQNNLLHIFWAERYGITPPEERKVTVGVRDVAAKLALHRAIDPRPLVEPRSLENRQIGNCRDFSTLMAAILRWQGVPARARCGFGVYFLPNHYEDHWVCEYWNAAQERWVMVDAQLDALQREVLEIPFDTLDVPPDQFIVAGKAWQLCRSGQADPDTFGIMEYKGLWFVRGNLIRDIMALNKVEILPWDGGFGLLDYTSGEPADADHVVGLLDRIAVLTQGGNPTFAELRSLYESEPGLHFSVPQTS